MGSDASVKTEDDLRRHKPVMLFGKNLMEIVCFRDSFICGICTGVVGGLGAFLFTSKTLLSTHVSFASLWVGVFGYWIPCRYKYETNLKKMEKLKNMYIKEYITEGTDSKSAE